MIIVSFVYFLQFGYYTNGYMHGGQFMGLPFFFIFATLLSFSFFKKGAFKIFIGPTIIYALVIIFYTEYAGYLRDPLGSEWHEYMFFEHNAYRIFRSTFGTGFAGIVISEIVLYQIVHRKKYH